MSKDQLVEFLMRLESDDVRKAAWLVDGKRRLKGQSSRLGLAKRIAVKEPLLNANTNEIFAALEKEPAISRARVPKDKLYKEIVVCPDNSKAAKLGKGWHERRWTVHTLKYAKGLILVTDRGEESSVFNGWAEMRSALIKSGWRILK